MMRFVRDVRLIPIVLIASVCLLALKAADLMLGEPGAGEGAPAAEATHIVHAMPDTPSVLPDQHSWAQQMFNFPNSGGGAAPAAEGRLPPLIPIAPSIASAASDSNRNNLDITGSVKTPSEKAAATGAAAAAGAKGNAGKDGNGAKDGVMGMDGKDGGEVKLAPGTVIAANGVAVPTGAERAILEHLVERRQQLEARARELDIREGLIQAAEKRMDGKIAELKDIEAHIAAETQAKDSAEAARFKGLVTMYESMKARDAAKIFDRLELGVLIEVASQINPRSMADILAQMSPDTAERLTVELANRAHAPGDKANANLPKIEGHPTAP
jgi:flagellar motility protein MotE (MotC chaperone)